MIVLSSCNDKDFEYPEGKVGDSFITKYANFTMKGERYVILKPGQSYVEPGVTAEAEGAALPVVIGGETVNTQSSGVYTIEYSATNKDGFTTSVSRTVVVADIKGKGLTNDLSGKYKRAATGQTAVWTKVAPGVYTVANPGGAAGADALTVIAVNEDEYQIKIPKQLASDGSPTNSENEKYTPASGSTPASYSWVIINPGYGTAARTFVKQ